MKKNPQELPTSYAFDIFVFELFPLGKKMFPSHATATEGIEYGVNATFNNISVISSLLVL